MLFLVFKTLVDQEVTVELKNDIEIKGTLKSVDQFLNLKLDNITCTNGQRYPYLGAVKNLFIRGSNVRYVHMNQIVLTVPYYKMHQGGYVYKYIFSIISAIN